MNILPAMKRALVVCGFALSLTVGQAAHAVVFDFTQDNCTGGCGTGPFGTVTLTQNGSSVDFVVHLNGGEFYVKSGAGDFQAFKFNATGVTLGDITVTAHNPTLVAATGAFDGDGGGLFAFGIGCPSCGNGGAGKFTGDILFSVANSLIADFLTANNKNWLFAADIMGTTGNTGLVGVTTTDRPHDEVPEPGSLALLGLGLLGLGAFRRRS